MLHTDSKVRQKAGDLLSRTAQQVGAQVSNAVRTKQRNLLRPVTYHKTMFGAARFLIITICLGHTRMYRQSIVSDVG